MPSAQTVPTNRGPARRGDTRLHGRWLAVARAGFIVLTATVVALNAVALPGLAAAQLTPDVLRQLHQAGVSVALYVAVGMVESIATALTYVAMGVLVFWRRSDNRMALFCALMLVTFGGVAATPLDDLTGGSPMPEPLAGSPALRALVYLLVVVGQVSFVVFFYLFPSGRFVPRWTLWCALLCGLYWLAQVVFPALSSGPLGIGILVFWLIAVMAQVYRYRRVSTPVEREQTKWIVFGFVVAFAIIAIPSLIPIVVPDIAQQQYTNSPLGPLIAARWVVAILLIPIVIALAILRTRLWDIDIIINRALVYGSLSAILAAVYFGSVIAMQQAVQVVGGPHAEQNPLVIVLSTLLIVVLFTPLRRRLQRAIDRRFYRTKYDAARTLERFAASLRNEVELGALSNHLVAAVDETMRPAHISLWLRQAERGARP